MVREVTIAEFLDYWEEGYLERILHVAELRRYYARKKKIEDLESLELIWTEIP